MKVEFQAFKNGWMATWRRFGSTKGAAREKIAHGPHWETSLKTVNDSDRAWFDAHAERITGFVLLGAFAALWCLSMWAGLSYCSGAHGLDRFVCDHASGVGIALLCAFALLAWLRAWIFGRTDSLVAAAAFVLSSLIAVAVYLWMAPTDVIEWAFRQDQDRR